MTNSPIPARVSGASTAPIDLEHSIEWVRGKGTIEVVAERDAVANAVGLLGAEVTLVFAGEPTGLDLIAAERARQIDAEGFTPGHDLENDRDALAIAAACYAMPDDLRDLGDLGLDPSPVLWPFEARWWKPTPGDRLRELVKAGAMIAAEVDRLLAMPEAAPLVYTPVVVQYDGERYTVNETMARALLADRDAGAEVLPEFIDAAVKVLESGTSAATIIAGAEAARAERAADLEALDTGGDECGDE